MKLTSYNEDVPNYSKFIPAELVSMCVDTKLHTYEFQLMVSNVFTSFLVNIEGDWLAIVASCFPYKLPTYPVVVSDAIELLADYIEHKHGDMSMLTTYFTMYGVRKLLEEVEVDPSFYVLNVTNLDTHSVIFSRNTEEE